ncbi:MAG: hypothetical protein FJ265_01390 [Planctomycetes bacterium]|nr:hypothetical protein [Planctomycetota bacterium]
MRICAAPFLTALLLTATATAQAGWLGLNPAIRPPARAMAGLAAMTLQNKCVLFGGEVTENGATLNDTWTWDGSAWSQLAIPGPPALEGFVMEYDPVRDRVVLFSGWNGAQYPQQTWEFDGAAWALRTPALSPRGRDWSAAAYDPVRGNLVLFGGHDWSVAGTTLADTWTWNGTNWTSQTASGPAARQGHAMAFDPVRNTVILFGGTGAGNDMWEWNGTAWSPIAPATVPPPRVWHRLVADPAQNRVLMIGGLWGTAKLDDVWQWNGIDWQQLTTIGTRPRGGYLACATRDPVTGAVLHFGGSVIAAPQRVLSDDATKLLVANATGWAVEEEYGTGCGAAADYASYYEQFAAGTFDLGGASGTENVVVNTFVGNGYLVVPGVSAWRAPQTPDLALGDDAVSGPLSLGFPLVLPNSVVTQQVWVCSNGYVWLTATGAADFSPTVAEFLAQGARLALYWTDLRPVAGGGSGTIHFDTDPANGMAYVTFVGVAAYSGGSTIDVQLAISANGNLEVRYGAETMRTSTQAALVGLTPGNGALDPGGTDLSLIGTTPILTKPDLFRRDLALSSGRPVLGSTANLVTSNIPAGSLLNALLFGLLRIDPGISLAPIGMPGCFQYGSQDASVLFVGPGTLATFPFAIPAGPALAGVSIKVQGAVYDPAGGHNTLGALASNGVELKLDSN